MIILMKVQSSVLWFFVKIYLYFAANSFGRRRGTLTSCVETKGKGEKVVICLQGKVLLEKPCTSSCSILCVLQMGLKYRDKQGKCVNDIDFRCNKNNHALCWGWQIRLSTLDHLHCSQPLAAGNRACLGLTIWPITLNTGHDFYNIILLNLKCTAYVITQTNNNYRKSKTISTGT